MIKFRSNITVALGGNLPFQGAPTSATLQQAIRAMAADGLVIRAVSRFFTTPCFPPGAGPDYVNAAVRLDTDLAPEALLSRLHAIEADFGRARDQRWGMRTLDLDILTYGTRILPDHDTQSGWRNLPLDQQVARTPDTLILPHPRLQDRAFALIPLADVAPDWRHPLLGLTVRQLCAALPAADVAAVRAI